MVLRSIEPLATLYEEDETAWLEATAELVRQSRYDELDSANLAEYLTDMALSQRREVENRLMVLVGHILKWHCQPKKRTRSWRGTVTVQRKELQKLVRRGVLRNHAKAVLAEAYADGVELAADETGLPAENFPSECPYTLDELLSPEVLKQ